MARGAEPLRSFRLESLEENTVNTNTNVMIVSTANPCATSKCTLIFANPSPALPSLGVTPISSADPAIAPVHWTAMNRSARTRVIFLVTSKATVTAGLICPPLMWAIIQTMVATARPKVNEIWTWVGEKDSHSVLRHAPHPRNTRSMVPIPSAKTPLHSLESLRSLRHSLNELVQHLHAILLLFDNDTYFFKSTVTLTSTSQSHDVTLTPTSRSHDVTLTATSRCHDFTLISTSQLSR